MLLLKKKLHLIFLLKKKQNIKHAINNQTDHTLFERLVQKFFKKNDLLKNSNINMHELETAIKSVVKNGNLSKEEIRQLQESKIYLFNLFRRISK